MVMAQEHIARIASHHWVRPDGESLFHAYGSARPGTAPFCGEGRPFASVREMDIPGYRSICCARCCEALYGPVVAGRKPE